MKTLIAVIMLTASVGCTGQDSEVRGTNLREIIEDQIRQNVRESYGELADQNFTWDDLQRFTRDNVPEQVTVMLRTNSVFLRAAEKVRGMPKAERDAYLKRCRLPLRKTWAELGEISPRGTTDAGRRAELALSNSIVDLAEKLLSGTEGGSSGEKRRGL